jgi:pilus assembly protein CpaC
MTYQHLMNRLFPASLACIFLWCIMLSSQVWGAGSFQDKNDPSLVQRLEVGESKLIYLKGPAPRIKLVDPAVADVMVLSPRKLYLIGKTPGSTRLILGSGKNLISSVIPVEVSPNAAWLKAKLFELLPDEKDIRVSAAPESITLSGTVSSAENLSQVLTLASSYAPVDRDGKARVMNFLQVGGVHQVMLEVRVSEMSKSLMRQLGVNFNYITESGNNLGISLLDNLTRLPANGWPANSTVVSDAINFITRFPANGTSWTFLIDALKQEGLVKVLAEPTLITLSGKTANFLAGGEYPIPVPQAAIGGTLITIVYKSFGVALKFTPTVLSTGRISMEVAPEVSELDFTNAVTIQGYIVPALTTRRVATTVELGDGQSFAIAGLLSDGMREEVRKFPVLGELPILGALFRSTAYQKEETELVIIVTPHLVKPVDMARQKLPTDSFIEPDDFEFYLMGNLEGRDRNMNKAKAAPNAPAKQAGGGLEGEFGHMTPQ